MGYLTSFPLVSGTNRHKLPHFPFNHVIAFLTTLWHFNCHDQHKWCLTLQHGHSMAILDISQLPSCSTPTQLELKQFDQCKFWLYLIGPILKYKCNNFHLTRSTFSAYVYAYCILDSKMTFKSHCNNHFELSCHKANKSICWLYFKQVLQSVHWFTLKSLLHTHEICFHYVCLISFSLQCAVFGEPIWCVTTIWSNSQKTDDQRLMSLIDVHVKC